MSIQKLFTCASNVSSKHRHAAAIDISQICEQKVLAQELNVMSSNLGSLMQSISVRQRRIKRNRMSSRSKSENSIRVNNQSRRDSSRSIVGNSISNNDDSNEVHGDYSAASASWVNTLDLERRLRHLMDEFTDENDDGDDDDIPKTTDRTHPIRYAKKRQDEWVARQSLPAAKYDMSKSNQSSDFDLDDSVYQRFFQGDASSYADGTFQQSYADIPDLPLPEILDNESFSSFAEELSARDNMNSTVLPSTPKKDLRLSNSADFWEIIEMVQQYNLEQELAAQNAVVTAAAHAAQNPTSPLQQMAVQERRRLRSIRSPTTDDDKENHVRALDFGQ